MKQGPRYHVKPRRHREHRTDYRRRLRLLKSRQIRIVVRKSLKQTRVQFVEYHQEGDTVLASAMSSELKNMKWSYSIGSTPAAYLTGLLAGTRAAKQGIEEGVLDLGRTVPTTGSKVFAALRGVLDAGVRCPHDESKLPSEDRIQGTHLNKDIASQMEKMKKSIAEAK